MGYRIGKKQREERSGDGTESAVVSSAGSVVTAGGEVSEEAAQPRQESRRSMVRLTLNVPRQLHTGLRLAAVRQERSVVSLVTEWIEERIVAV